MNDTHLCVFLLRDTQVHFSVMRNPFLMTPSPCCWVQPMTLGASGSPAAQTRPSRARARCVPHAAAVTRVHPFTLGVAELSPVPTSCVSQVTSEAGAVATASGTGGRDHTLMFPIGRPRAQDFRPVRRAGEARPVPGTFCPFTPADVAAPAPQEGCKDHSAPIGPLLHLGRDGGSEQVPPKAAFHCQSLWEARLCTACVAFFLFTGDFLVDL